MGLTSYVCRNCFKSDKVAEISYASKRLFRSVQGLVLKAWNSDPRKGLFGSEVPQQLRDA
jgi:hypothetical protein